MAEIDFLIVMRGLILVLEIKGGRISRHNGTWQFTDRYGHVHDKREGPFEQARSAMFALTRTLEERVAGLQIETGAVVITPDQHLARDIEWSPLEHLGPPDMTVDTMTRGLRAAAKHCRSHRRPARPTDIGDMLQVLRPDFDRIPGLSSLAGSLEQDYLRLAAEQYQTLLGAEINPRLFVTGGAGSGKTLLAIETARRAAERVLLTCRSAGVIDLMRKRLVDTQVSCRRLDELLAVEATATVGETPFETLVVDEAQDLMSVEDYLVMDGLLVGGLREGRWRMFSDPNNQAHVDGHLDDDVHRDLVALAARYHLPYNCRNPAPVVTQTQLITGADLGVPRVGYGPPVEFDRIDSDTDVADLIDARLKRLRRDEISAEDIVVISLRSETAASAARDTKAYRRGTLTDQPDGASSAARLVTAAAIKGLEAAHVLVVDVDHLDDHTDFARLYVAMTRPRVSLWVAVADAAWKRMTSQALAQGAPNA